MPAAARVLWEAALSLLNPWGFTQVHARNANRAPMLFIAGSIDHVVPPVTARATVRYYQKRSNAVTEYKEFAGRTHFLAGQDGWEEIADYALDWALRHLPHRERTVVTLRFFDGLTQSEIALRMGISQMHVSRLLRASLEVLRERIGSDAATA